MTITRAEIDTEARRRAKLRMEERSTAILKWTAKATRPLFAPDNSGGAEHVGSCVLLRIHDTCFALTAAHVLDSIADNEGLYARTPIGMTELVGVRHKTSAPKGGRRLDRVDIGFVELEPVAVNALSSCLFLSVDQLDVDDLADHTPVYGTKYMALGYPHQLVSKDGAANARFVPWVGRPKRLAASRKLKKLKEESHCLVEMNIRELTTQLQLSEPFDPTGMSGGGLYRFGTLMPRSRQEKWSRFSEQVG